jgi:SAM-dependent methyltransferase
MRNPPTADVPGGQARMGSLIRSVARRCASFLFRSRADNVADLLLKKSGWYNETSGALAPHFRIAPSDTVVDAGCGGGLASVFAAMLGAEVVSIDVDPAAIESVREGIQKRVFKRRLAGLFRPSVKAVKLRPFHAVVSDCNPIPLPADYATAVLAMEVLEHVDDPAAFLTEMVRIGRPGARYFITVPDPASESVLRMIAPPEMWQKPYHVRVFERDEIQRVVEHAGLIVEQRYACGFYWSMWWALFWTLPKNSIFPGMSGKSALLRNWNKTWKTLLSSPRGDRLWEVLDSAMPKSQVIVARKVSP